MIADSSDEFKRQARAILGRPKKRKTKRSDLVAQAKAKLLQQHFL